MQNSTLLKPSGLLKKLQSDFPDITFTESGQFSWHAKGKHVSYPVLQDSDARESWALLHEVGHALLDHTDFLTDIALLKMEVAAWEKAKQLGADYRLPINDDYIENCLDSYRDWLHVRATCPTCYERCLQADKQTYQCHNCGCSWKVTRSRLCRPYRRKNERT